MLKGFLMLCSECNGSFMIQFSLKRRFNVEFRDQSAILWKIHEDFRFLLRSKFVKLMEGEISQRFLNEKRSKNQLTRVKSRKFGEKRKFSRIFEEKAFSYGSILENLNKNLMKVEVKLEKSSFRPS